MAKHCWHRSDWDPWRDAFCCWCNTPVELTEGGLTGHGPHLSETIDENLPTNPRVDEECPERPKGEA